MTTNTNETYFVEIQPIGYYFFGGERTFNTAQTDKYKKPIANYYAISNPYPQQTALLGLLRYTMLVMTNMLHAKNHHEKESIIGKSFNGISKTKQKPVVRTDCTPGKPFLFCCY